MRSLRRIFAGVAGLGLVAASTLPAAAAFGSPSQAQSVSRVLVSKVPHSLGLVRDLGRRAPGAPITAHLQLRYNHEAELNSLIESQADSTSPLFHHFLTSVQFNAYFAPTPAQHAYVIASLRAAGMRVTQTFANRTIIDVAGPSVSAERYFGTEIHTVSQSGYGTRFMNVRPATLSADLAPLVRSVNISNLIVAKTPPLKPSVRAFAQPSRIVTSGSKRTVAALGRFRISGVAATRMHRDAEVENANVVTDPGFESGGFSNGWLKCESATVSDEPRINTKQPDSGKYSGVAGTDGGGGEPVGYSGVCQLVTIPKHGILTADVSQMSNETDATYAAQDVFLINTQGYITGIASQTVTNGKGYVVKSWDLSAFKGQQVYIYFGVHGDGDKSFTTKQYVDNVSLLTGTPSSSIPVVAENLVPAKCTDTPDSGPLTAPDSDGGTGDYPTGIAKAFDFPVQHGCGGSGETAGIVIEGMVAPSDLAAYLKASGVTQTGKVVYVPVDGGTTNTNSGEANLDIETVVGLAPAATVNVYLIPNLSGDAIADAYNRAISDNTAVAVNSSFGGCEDDSDESTDALYMQGSAVGITFVGTTGDTGSDECNNGPNGAPSKGVSDDNGPHAVAIGSTDYTQDSSTGALTGLVPIGGSPPGPGNDFSGGGVSTVYPLPRYQMGIANVIASGRNQPDLALPGTNAPIVIGGMSETTGGTSFSGPIFTALLTTAEQLHGQRGFGFANPMIYNMFRASGYTTDFIDDATGGNNIDYTAIAGYDQVTGIGVPTGFAFGEGL